MRIPNNKYLLLTATIVLGTMLGNLSLAGETAQHLDLTENQIRSAVIYRPGEPFEFSGQVRSSPLVIKVAIASSSGKIQSVEFLQSPQDFDKERLILALKNWQFSFHSDLNVRKSIEIQGKLTFYTASYGAGNVRLIDPSEKLREIQRQRQ